MSEPINSNLADDNKSFQQRVDEVRSVAEENLRYTKTLYEAYQAKNAPGSSAEELLAKNIELSQKIYELTLKIKRYFFWQQIFTAVKILLIVVPLIVGAIYVYPMLLAALSSYQQLLR